jgi:hypothetical protein
LPLALMVIDRVVAPVDQRYDAPLEAVSATLPPVQNVVGPPVIVAVTGTGAATVVVPDATQPAAAVTCTLYVPAVETEIDWVVAPVDQR